jgi:Fe-S oxidoreductase
MDSTIFEACETCLQDEPAASTAMCPVHVDVPAFAAEMEKGEFKKAYKLLEKRLPFAGIIGMICDHPCESACVRKDLDRAISVSALERAAVQYGYVPYKKGASIPKNKGNVAVVGGGISGITAAFELDKKGFRVTVYEQSDRLGGRIWDFEGDRISKDHIEEELLTVERLDIQVEYGRRIGEKELESLTREYDAVYLGTGRWETGLRIDPDTFQVNGRPVFAGGKLCSGNDSVILSVSSGKKAAVSIERHIKKISLTASREKEGSYETPLKYNIEFVEPDYGALPEHGIYTEEEARREALRCLKCHCTDCLNACSHLRKFSITPKSYGRQIQINESVIMGTRYANTMINSCTLCGLCKEVCPVDIGMKDVIHQTRESMTEKNKMPPSAHDFALRDMEFSNSGRFSLIKPPPSYKGGTPVALGETGAMEGSITSNTKYLFYPGCQLSASCPEQVEKSYRYLLDAMPDQVGLMLGCCGAPADWAGRNDLMRESAEKIRSAWNDQGKPIFILACSSCISVFERYLPEIPYISLWEIFQREGLPESAKLGQGRILSIHDACSTRYHTKLHDSVRNLVSDLGYSIKELRYAKEKTKCCGYGGLVYFANRDQADSFAQDRTEESPNDLLVYCAMCKDLFAAKGKKTFHLLDLVFSNDPEQEATQKMPNLSERHENRAHLKNKLLRELWGEEPEAELTEQNKLNLVIPDPVWETMEKRQILFEDIERVITHSRISGERFFNSKDQTYLTNFRFGRVTYWVCYEEKEDGIHVKSAYSHRMEVLKE